MLSKVVPCAAVVVCEFVGGFFAAAAAIGQLEHQGNIPKNQHQEAQKN